MTFKRHCKVRSKEGVWIEIQFVENESNEPFLNLHFQILVRFHRKLKKKKNYPSPSSHDLRARLGCAVLAALLSRVMGLQFLVGSVSHLTEYLRQ